jgi:hypothetical protein
MGPLPLLATPSQSDVVYCAHEDTLDGWLASWVIREIAKKYSIPVEFTTEVDATPKLPDRNCIVIGGEHPATYYDETESKSLVSFRRVSDETEQAPIPFRFWERTQAFGIKTMSPKGRRSSIHNSKLSLSRLVWEFFYAEGGAHVPYLFVLVNDHLSGVHRFLESRAVVECVQTYPRSFANLDKLIEACEDRKKRALMIAGGQAVMRYVERM